VLGDPAQLGDRGIDVLAPVGKALPQGGDVGGEGFTGGGVGAVEDLIDLDLGERLGRIKTTPSV
jgi:hypothetical protein